MSEKKKSVRLGVIQEWSVGTTVYRGRKADLKKDYTRILLTPHIELSPPASNRARPGRMNPGGVPVFYGALDRATCLAEMRSSIGEHIVVGVFKTIKALRLLDFNRLDKALWGGKGLSYFQLDYKEQVATHKFRRQLHRLISQPIVPGHEGDYLITQVLAEYLAYVREPNFDGLLFSSTQHEGGTNVVLFSKGYNGEVNMLTQFSVKNIKDSAELYQTRKIEYDIPKLNFSIEDNDIHIFPAIPTLSSLPDFMWGERNGFRKLLTAITPLRK